MDEQRRRQYISEAGRLLREMPEDARRELMTDLENREALRDIRQETFDEMARQFARTGEFQMPWGQGAPRGRRPSGEDGRGERSELTEEERDQRRRERQDQMRNRISEAFESGNAQSTALRGEFFKRMRESGQFGGRPGGRGGR